MITKLHKKTQKKMNEFAERIAFTAKNNNEVRKVISDPNYIYSAEFAMKHANIVDNGDGTISFKRPTAYIKND